MKKLSLLVLLSLSLAASACGAAPATTESTPIPPVVADQTVITEGQLEPIHFAELALNASGLVSEVLVARLEASAARLWKARRPQPHRN